MKRLLGLLLLSPMFAFADAAEDLKKHLDHIQDLKGRFVQTITDKSGQVLQNSQGDFTVKRPGFFLWKSEAPFEQTVVGTPEKVWIYDPDLEQVTMRKVLAQGGDNPAELLSGDLADLRSTYEVSVQKEADGSTFQLVPKKQESPYRSITFRFDAKQLNGLYFQDKLDQHTRIQFDKTQVNTSISQDVFHFTPPEGADVIIDE